MELLSQQPDTTPSGVAPVGSVVADRYRILDVAGTGGMGVVYKAQHIHMSRTIALKMLLRELSADAQAFKRFQQEARAASLLSHPHIIGIHDFGVVEDNQAYLAMDFLDGRSLQSVFHEQGPMPLSRFMHIFAQACDGLGHAHAHGVVHRDIKPSNLILVNRDDDPDFLVIVDFGLVKLMASNSDVKLTSTNMLVGSPLYMSPEQCRGLDLDHRSDIYSLGCVMYEAVTGVLPFTGETALDALYKHVAEEAPPMSTANPDAHVPPPVEQVIRKAMSKLPEQRQQSMKELRDELADAIANPDKKVAVPLSTKAAAAAPQPRRSGPNYQFLLFTTLPIVLLLLVAVATIARLLQAVQQDNRILTEEQKRIELMEHQQAAASQRVVPATVVPAAAPAAKAKPPAARLVLQQRPAGIDPAIVAKQEQTLEDADDAFQRSDLARAGLLYRQWLQEQQQISPGWQAVMAPVYAKLAISASGSGDQQTCNQSLDHLQAVLLKYPQVLNDDPRVLRADFELAEKSGRYQLADLLLRKAIAWHDKQDPHDNRQAWVLRMKLADVFKEEGRTALAKQELTQIANDCAFPGLRMQAMHRLQRM